MPIDFVKNAESLGACAIAAGTAEEFQAALEEARPASRTTLIYVPVDAEARVPNYEGWWDVPIAEVSEEESVQSARTQHEKDAKRQRVFV